MDYNDTLINEAIKQKRLILFDFDTPLSSFQNIWLSVTSFNCKTRKVKGFIYSSERLMLQEFLAGYNRDDMKNIRLLPVGANLTSKRDDYYSSVQAVFLEAFYAEEYTRFSKINDRSFQGLLQAYKLGTQKSAVSDKLTLEYSVLGVMIKEEYFPFLSQEVLFDVADNKLVYTQKYTVHERIKFGEHTYNLSFLWNQDKQALIEAFEDNKEELVTRLNEASNEYTFTESSRYLVAHTPLSDHAYKHFQAMQKVKAYTPIESLFGRLTVKNQKRKEFNLAFTDEVLDMRLYHAMYTSFKHPVTTLELPYDYDITPLIKIIHKTTSLNDKSVLIVTPNLKEALKVEKILSCVRQFSFLNTTSPEAILSSLNRLPLNVYPKLTATGISSDTVEPFFTNLERLNKQIETLSNLEKMAKIALRESRLMEYINAESSLNDLYKKHHLKCDAKYVQSLYTSMPSVNGETLLLSRASERLNHTHLGAFKALLIENVTKESAEKATSMLASKTTANRIKNTFQLTLATAQSVALFHPSTQFDFVVFMNGDTYSLGQMLMPLNMAKHALFIDSEVGYDKRLNTDSDWPFIYDFNHFSALEMIHSIDTNMVVQSLREEKVRKLSTKHKVHEVTTEDDTHNHASEALQSYTHTMLKNRHDALVILTPFEAQKRAYKKHYKSHPNIHVDSLLSKKHYAETVFVDAMVHKGLKQVTYDWLKNHPDVLKTLDRAKGNIEVLIDYDSLGKLSDGRDGLYQRIVALKNRALVNALMPTTQVDYWLESWAGYNLTRVEILKSIPQTDTDLFDTKTINECAAFYNENNRLVALYCHVPLSFKGSTKEKIYHYYKTLRVDTVFIVESKYNQFKTLLKHFTEIFSIDYRDS